MRGEGERRRAEANEGQTGHKGLHGLAVGWGVGSHGDPRVERRPVGSASHMPGTAAGGT